jgi:hypothetical protein
MILTMVYNTHNYWDFGLHPSSDILKRLEKITFWKLILFPSSDEEGDTSSVGSLGSL